MAFQFPRLNAILGASPESITHEQLQALTSNDAAAEAEDLDYKLRYEPGEQGSDDVAVDIATFANHLGGVIVVGMAEANARPSKVVGVELTDDLERWIHTRVADRVFPKPQFRLRCVPDPTDTSKTPRGILLIMVPRSPMAPHAVAMPREKEKLRWPRRHGTGKIWLSESEIAASYRRRFVAAAEQTERLTTVEAECFEGIKRQKDDVHPYTSGLLLVSLVPETPGEMVIDSDSYARFVRDIRQQPACIGDDQIGALGRAGVGRRRFVCESMNWRRIRAELHSDGSGSVAVHLPGGTSSDGPARVWDTSVVVWAASALRLLARHARDRSGASGSAMVSAAIKPYTQGVNGSPILGGTLIIQTASPFGSGGEAYGAEEQATARGEGDFLIDHLADDGQPLAQATARLVGDLFQTFNAVGTRQITSEGTLLLNTWGSERGLAESWASATGIPTEQGN